LWDELENDMKLIAAMFLSVSLASTFGLAYAMTTVSVAKEVLQDRQSP